MNLYELYHENSKLSGWDWETQARVQLVNEYGLQLPTDSPVVDSTCLDTTVLPNPDPLDGTLVDALAMRRSAWKCSEVPLEIGRLSRVLHYSCGLNGSLSVNGEPMRALRYYPSPGALYPNSVFVESRNVIGLSLGLYCYDQSVHGLARMSAQLEDLTLALAANAVDCPWACVIWLMSRIERLAFKYGERSYRFALLEAGHIAQNILLVCASSGLAARPFGGFLDDVVIRAMDAGSFGLKPIYAIGIGCLAIP